MKIIHQHNVASGGACLPCGPSQREIWNRIALDFLDEMMRRDLADFIRDVVGPMFSAQHFPGAAIGGPLEPLPRVAYARPPEYFIPIKKGT
jgi:hypothetical protein